MFLVVFEVQPHAAQHQQYLDFGKLLRPELEQVAGFIDNERFTSTRTAGRVLSLSTWRDEKALIRWRTHALHHQVQEQGRTLVFNNYKLQVGEITHDTRPPDGYQVRHQRLDTTEVSDATVLLLIESAAPPTGTSLSNALLQVVTTDDTPDGWVIGESFVSIYNPGRSVVLTGWRNAAAAQAWHAATLTALEPSVAPRCRFVRVIRAYGMFDRREAPQYYPAIQPMAPTLLW